MALNNEPAEQAYGILVRRKIVINDIGR